MDNIPIDITRNHWPEATKPLVTVCNWVYNHKAFIEKSIDSILMQKTNFPVEIIIQDDASNDGTREIINKYNLKYPQLFNNILFEENQYSQGKDITISLLSKAKGKYVALAHGDDYWTDPYKLQKQVDFLERNPAYVITWTQYSKLHDNLISYPYQIEENRTITHENFSSTLCHTLTCVFKVEAIKNYSILAEFHHFKDLSLYFLVLNSGKGYYFNDCTSVYRIHSGGIWSGGNLTKNLIDDTFTYIEIYFKIAKVKWLKEKTVSGINQVLKRRSSYRLLGIKMLLYFLFIRTRFEFEIWYSNFKIYK